MAKTNYHIHTKFSDGKGEIEEYVENAIKEGFDEIGFSDHLTLLDELPPWSMSLEDLEHYTNSVLQVARETPEVKVRLGVEMDYLPGKIPEISSITKNNRFDYVIGSVHYVDGTCCVDCSQIVGKLEKMTSSDIYELYIKYYQLLRDAARSGLFDIIGHPDVIKKFGFRPERNIDDLLRETASAFAESGVAVEVNTSGLKKPCKEIYPSRRFLEFCFDCGVPVALGSDAHRPEDMGVDEGIELVREVGYNRIATFSNRNLKEIPL
jgi:histidinol-phosphatase (PHP family)